MNRRIRKIPAELIDRERFASLSGAGAPDECWPWLGHVDPLGYGRFRASRVSRAALMAHRVAYTLNKGPIPEGLVIDHLCRNRACVNPRHLEAVTNEENIARGQWCSVVNASKTHCRNGHPYDEENTSHLTRGERRCRQCGRDAAKRHYYAKKERLARQASE